MVEPWRQRLDQLGLTKADVGIVVNLILALPREDREAAVDLDLDVANSSVKERIKIYLKSVEAPPDGTGQGAGENLMYIPTSICPQMRSCTWIIA